MGVRGEGSGGRGREVGEKGEGSGGKGEGSGECLPPCPPPPYCFSCLRAVLFSCSRRMYTLSGAATMSKLFCPPSKNRSALKEIICYPLEKILCFLSRPLLRRGLLYNKTNRKSQKLSSL